MRFLQNFIHWSSIAERSRNISMEIDSKINAKLNKERHLTIKQQASSALFPLFIIGANNEASLETFLFTLLIKRRAQGCRLFNQIAVLFFLRIFKTE